MHSLSKRSNLAGYRCAFVAGDPAVVGELLAVRKNLGLMMPGPQQRAMVAALDDDVHVEEQHARYAARRTTLRAALESAGFRIDHSEASLYLWATRDEDCWDTVAWLAERGILVAPGSFYGRAGAPPRAGGVHRHRRAGRRGVAPTGLSGVPEPDREYSHVGVLDKQEYSASKFCHAARRTDAQGGAPAPAAAARAHRGGRVRLRDRHAAAGGGLRRAGRGHRLSGADPVGGHRTARVLPGAVRRPVRPASTTAPPAAGQEELRHRESSWRELVAAVEQVRPRQIADQEVPS